MLEDFLLFLGLLGFVCSIGMRWAARRDDNPGHSGKHADDGERRDRPPR